MGENDAPRERRLTKTEVVFLAVLLAMPSTLAVIGALDLAGRWHDQWFVAVPAGIAIGVAITKLMAGAPWVRRKLVGEENVVTWIATIALLGPLVGLAIKGASCLSWSQGPVGIILQAIIFGPLLFIGVISQREFWQGMKQKRLDNYARAQAAMTLAGPPPVQVPLQQRESVGATDEDADSS